MEDNNGIIIYLTVISILLTFISVILIPLFKYTFYIEKRLTALETKEEVKKELKKS